ncbi:putative protein2-like [Crotalus adamanteus]|uniref:EF-hand domain-containing protein n=1 Tax=Crotalus adamanteus TaxID=8729 RepID=A0AAW1ANE0_CROAD
MHNLHRKKKGGGKAPEGSIKDDSVAKILTSSGTNLALLSINTGDQKQSKMSKTQLEKCCDCIMDVFHKYSMPLDHPDKLSKGEFAKMLREQLPNFIQSTKNTEAMNRLFNELDQNKDGELSFEEWLTLIGRFLAQEERKGGREEGKKERKEGIEERGREGRRKGGMKEGIEKGERGKKEGRNRKGKKGGKKGGRKEGVEKE